MASLTEKIDATFPDDGQRFGKHASYVRNYKNDLVERFSSDHYMDSELDTTSPLADGFHKKVNMKELSSSPTAISGAGIVHSKLNGTTNGVYYTNSSITYNINKISHIASGSDITFGPFVGVGLGFINAPYTMANTYNSASPQLLSFVDLLAIDSSIINVSTDTITTPNVNILFNLKYLMKLSYTYTLARSIGGTVTRSYDIYLRNSATARHISVDNSVTSIFSSTFFKTNPNGTIHKFAINSPDYTIVPDSGWGFVSVVWSYTVSEITLETIIL